MVGIAAIFSDLVIILATGYAVFVLNHSGWWFLLTILFMTTVSTKKQGTKQ